MLPESVKGPLLAHLAGVRQLHQRDLESGGGRVHLPYVLARKYPRADQEWGWQYVFPASDLSRDPRTGRIGRHEGGRGLAMDLLGQEDRHQLGRELLSSPVRPCRDSSSAKSRETSATL